MIYKTICEVNNNKNDNKKKKKKDNYKQVVKNK